jgi:hypothetical protein
MGKNISIWGKFLDLLAGNGESGSGIDKILTAIFNNMTGYASKTLPAINKGFDWFVNQMKESQTSMMKFLGMTETPLDSIMKFLHLKADIEKGLGTKATNEIDKDPRRKLVESQEISEEQLKELEKFLKEQEALRKKYGIISDEEILQEELKDIEKNKNMFKSYQEYLEAKTNVERKYFMIGEKQRDDNAKKVAQEREKDEKEEKKRVTSMFKLALDIQENKDKIDETNEKNRILKQLQEHEYEEKAQKEHAKIILEIQQDLFSSISDSIASWAGDSKTTFAQFQKEMLLNILKGLEKYLAVAQGWTTIYQLATSGFLGIGKAIALISIEELAFKLAEAKISSWDGKYAEGKIGLDGPGTSKSDSLIIRASKGESVITALGTENAPKMLTAINEGLIKDSDYIISNSNSTSTYFETKRLEEKLERQIEATEKMSKKMNNLGFSYIKNGRIYIVKADGTTEIMINK